jgi:hypothetical protein
MPDWLYNLSPLKCAIVITVIVETLALTGLILTRRFVVPRLRFVRGTNDAISGTVQTIGVFYGVTVGLIAVAVWTTNSSCRDLVSREAAAIAALYRDVGGYPQPLKNELSAMLKDYTVFVIERAWPAQRSGTSPIEGVQLLNQFQNKLFAFEPANSGQEALHAETLRAYNNLIEYRRLRIEAVDGGLSLAMWSIIWIGAAISIGVAYFFKVQDWRFHMILVAMMAGFLSLVFLMIVINDRPFFGAASISPEPYKIILERVIAVPN